MLVQKIFNDTVQQWIGFLDEYTLEDLCRRPSKDAWSLGQVYVHLIDDTEWFVRQIKTALATEAHRDEEMHPAAKAMFRNNAFPDIRMQGPATGTDIPQPPGIAELRAKLRSIQDEVNQLDFTLSAGGKTPHPGFQYFDALEWLQFAEMHLRHHLKQKKRIDAVIFPG